MLDLDHNGASDPLGMLPLFLMSTDDVPAPRLSVVFRRLVRLGSFPRLAGDRSMPPPLERVHRPPQLPTTYRFT